jgi:hypothetical protein
MCCVQGQKLICELTGKPASVVVNYFGIQYYYCDRQTLELDWNGIKHKIAQLLVPLRRPPAIIPSVEERERQEANIKKSKMALIDLCRLLHPFSVAQTGQTETDHRVTAMTTL